MKSSNAQLAVIEDYTKQCLPKARGIKDLVINDTFLSLPRSTVCKCPICNDNIQHLQSLCSYCHKAGKAIYNR